MNRRKRGRGMRWGRNRERGQRGARSRRGKRERKRRKERIIVQALIRALEGLSQKWPKN